MGISLGKNDRKRNRRQLSSEINVTPLVDVMLVLLIIFMVCSPMLVAGVQVDLPKTKASSLSGQDEPIAITIDKYGNVYVQEAKVKIADLGIKLSAVLKEKKDTRIFVRGDRKIDYGKVMEVFGAIKAGGFSNVALVTEALDK
ncbi:MAG: protein TolR [Rickettsiales bacterium]